MNRTGKSSNMDFFYDEQIRRYVLQWVRVFSGFQVREVYNGEYVYHTVPARYADSSRMVSHILRHNSENIINSAPMITVAIENIKMMPDRRQEPFHINTRQVAEREFDRSTGEYTSKPGNLYTIQTHMPVPYNAEISVDIWTTNSDTKTQLLEQMLVLFNPGLQLQQNNNPLDDTNVFEFFMTDTQWSNRSLPTGVDDVIDISTLKFESTMWLNPPAKVKRQKIINTIITNIHSVDTVEALNYDGSVYQFFDRLTPDAQVVVTPGDYHLEISGDTATLLTPDGEPASWRDLIAKHGYLEATSRISLNTTNNIENELDLIYGGISYTGDDSVLRFDLIPDTLPQNTLASFNMVIDPQQNFPGDGSLPAPVVGQRYLITSDLNSDSPYSQNNWSGVEAVANDILEFNGATWSVAFDSSSIDTHTYVTNAYTGQQFVWTGENWQGTYEGIYNPGYFRLEL